MKRLSILSALIVMGFAYSCNEANTDKAPTTTDNVQRKNVMLENNHQVMRAIETGDTATLQRLIADDAVDHGGGPEGGDLRGDEIVNSLATIHNDIDNLKFEVIEEAANDDHIFSLVHMTGTTNKPVWGFPANHKIDSRSVDVIKVKDGKMVDHWGYFDMNEMMQMMQAQKDNAGAGTTPPANTNQ